MNPTKVICPKCNFEFDTSEQLSDYFKQEAQKEYRQKYSFAVKKKEEEIRKEIIDKVSLEMDDLKIKNKELEQQKRDWENKELQIRQQKRELEEKEKQINDKINDEVNKQSIEIRKEIYEVAKKDALSENEIKFKDLENQINEQKNKNCEIQNQTVEIAKQKRALEDKIQSWEYEKEKLIDEERNKVKKLFEDKLDNEKSILKKQNDDLIKKIEVLERSSKQTSQQLQGESFELTIEQLLKQNFIYDSIKPVPTGRQGADIIHTIRNEIGKNCGNIIWEVKDTKTWDNKWIDKLLEDQRNMKAGLAVIVTSVLPKDINSFGLINKIWITDFKSFINLGYALRFGIIEIAKQREAMTNRTEKMEILYEYLTSNAFKHRIEMLIETFDNMRKDLEKEKSSIQLIWAKREQQINKVSTATSMMWGDLTELIGSTLHTIERFELFNPEFTYDYQLQEANENEDTNDLPI